MELHLKLPPRYLRVLRAALSAFRDEGCRPYCDEDLKHLIWGAGSEADEIAEHLDILAGVALENGISKTEAE